MDAFLLKPKDDYQTDKVKTGIKKCIGNFLDSNVLLFLIWVRVVLKHQLYMTLITWKQPVRSV